jgi:glycosyltransferase involved in cell wall biosynthesis
MEAEAAPLSAPGRLGDADRSALDGGVSMRRRVLYVCHNHPALFPGGTEIYSHALHDAMRSATEYEPMLLARAEGPAGGRVRGGTLVSMVDEATDEYLFHTDRSRFDGFLLRSSDPAVSTRFFRDVLRATRPDVVHFQHTLLMGYELVREARNTLPDAALVYTLHDYLAICHRQGQMVRTVADDELCTHASPRRCHECFPDRSVQEFFLRKQLIQAHLAAVDLFLAPSEFLRRRYVEWGIAAERIRVEENGMTPVPAHEEERRPVRNRLGFFGQIHRYKGLHVLLRAMRLLPADHPDIHLWINGANLAFEKPEYRAEIERGIADCGELVTVNGPYRHADLPGLMAAVDWVVVPSVAWENSPLVIQEAFLHRRPVICADIGGMAEKVRPDQYGLHFRARDPHSLAATVARAVLTPGLWDQLARALPTGHAMDIHRKTLIELYDELLSRKPR